MDPGAVEGRTFIGHVKSYSRSKGYGFVLCDQVCGDLFFLHKNVPKEVISRTAQDEDFFLEGKEVAFTVEMSADGKALATEIRLLADGSNARPGKGKGKGDDAFGSRPEWDEPRGPVRGGARSQGTFGHKGGNFRGARAQKGFPKDTQPGRPILDERINATMKSYSLGSRWGFAVCDPSIGDFGDIFVHIKNLEYCLQDMALREGDAIEADLEDVNGKVVAKRVTLVAQDPCVFDGHFLKGVIKSYKGDFGFINAPRIDGDIWFAKQDLPKSMMNVDITGCEVMFRLKVAEGKPKAKMVNALDGLPHWEGVERANAIIDSLHSEQFLDEAAVETLQSNALDFLTILPDLEFYKANNPSSFILGSLSSSRKAEKGKGRSRPY